MSDECRICDGSESVSGSSASESVSEYSSESHYDSESSLSESSSETETEYSDDDDKTERSQNENENVERTSDNDDDNIECSETKSERTERSQQEHENTSENDEENIEHSDAESEKTERSSETNSETEWSSESESESSEGFSNKSKDDKNEEDKLRKEFTGFDGYPEEIQNFIKENKSVKNTDINVEDGEEGEEEETEKEKEQKEEREITQEKEKEDVEELIKDSKEEAEEKNKEALEKILSGEKIGGNPKKPKAIVEEEREEKEKEGENAEDAENKAKEEAVERNKEALEKILGDEEIGRDRKKVHSSHSRKKRHIRKLSEVSDHSDNSGHRGHRRYIHKQSDESRDGWRLSKIICPTGKEFFLSMPVRKESDWRCNQKSKLITLQPDGRMGRREYKIVSQEMQNSKLDVHGKFSKYDIIKIQKIVNPCLWKRYRYRRWQIMRENGKANDHLLWHGARPAIIAELVDTGFDERHANPNGLFGAGLYFAPNSSKSNIYIGPCVAHNHALCFACERQLLLCRVSLGKVQQYTEPHNHAHAPQGYHSVEGVTSQGRLLSNENIVYRGEQVYPEFLITYKMVP